MSAYGPSPTYCDVRDLAVIRGKAEPHADIEFREILTRFGNRVTDFAVTHKALNFDVSRGVRRSCHANRHRRNQLRHLSHFDLRA
jgi:hypothetical protein